LLINYSQKEIKNNAALFDKLYINPLEADGKHRKVIHGSFHRDINE